MTTDIIPHNIWLFLKEFVDSKVTGQIVLRLKDGVIMGATFGQDVKSVWQ